MATTQTTEEERGLVDNLVDLIIDEIGEEKYSAMIAAVFGDKVVGDLAKDEKPYCQPYCSWVCHIVGSLCKARPCIA